MSKEADEPEKLEMTFDPMTIEHLGVRMYSTLPPVISELIANSADADATHVHILLEDGEGSKLILVDDDGDGMSYADLNEKFLRIGRNRREEENKDTTKKGRKIIGKKGLGKLSFFGIATEIEVTTRKDGFENTFSMSWDSIKAAGVKKENYLPTPIKIQNTCDPKLHGTRITLRGIQREGSFTPESLATSLSKIFIVDSSFSISIQHNDEVPVKVTNIQKYEHLDKEVEWNVPKDLGGDQNYLLEKKIEGHLIATKKPIPPNTNMRGITLFSRKKLVNLPEYFSDSTSSHFYSYLTGWLEVDFIDDLPEDVISTDRQSLNWSHPEMEQLRNQLRAMLNWLERDWRQKRSIIREGTLAEKTGINVPEWFSALPDDIKAKIQPIMETLVRDAELSEEVMSKAAQNLHDIVPEYPRYHWRHLHPEIKGIAKEDYINGRYFDAAEKVTRLYLQRVKEKAGVDSGKDDNDMDAAFNVGDGKLMITDCSDPTRRNIQSGHQMLSKGVVFAFRNPLTHNPEYQTKLVDSGLFTEKDCLDILSLVSYLFTSLDKAQLRS